VVLDVSECALCDRSMTLVQACFARSRLQSIDVMAVRRTDWSVKSFQRPIMKSRAASSIERDGRCDLVC
jgi:hypothetical protein